MNTITLYAILSAIMVSLMSFIGIITLSFKREWINKILVFLVSLSAGTLLGDSFIHLLPEAVEASGGLEKGVSLLILSGIVGFFVLEKFILWHHHHQIESFEEHRKEASEHFLTPHHLGVMNLLGGAFHDLLDGMVIAASFLISPVVGFSTTIAVILHEIPQEIGDFGVLLHSGLSVKKAVLLNFLSGTLGVVGAVLVLNLETGRTTLINALIPLTAGGFIYLALSDLVPELKKSSQTGISLFQLFSLTLGIGLMLALRLWE